MSNNTEIKHYSLGELAESLKSVISKTYTRKYWIRAEIAKLNYYPKTGHCYPELIEKENDQVKTQMRAIIWASSYAQLSKNFRKETGEELRSGISILFRASIHFHELYGLSLQIHDIEASFTLGELARQRLETIARLKKEGLWFANKQLDAPILPQRIAVISAASSKGFQDFIQTLSASQYRIEVQLFTAVLQGDKAIRTIPEELEKIQGQESNFDLIAIIRGGGSDVGLSCYDHYGLASAIAASPLPVITGIGHSTNETLSELVAFENLITPTAVAQYIINHFTEEDDHILDILDRIMQQSSAFIQSESLQLKTFSHQCTQAPLRMIQGQMIQIGNYGKRCSKDSRHMIWKSGFQLKSYTERIKKQSFTQVPFASGYLQQIMVQLAKHSTSLLAEEQQKQKIHHHNIMMLSKKEQQQATQKINYLEERLRLLNPKNILKRGFSITLHQGKAVKNPAELNKGDRITSLLADGSIKSIISETASSTEKKKNYEQDTEL